MADRIDAISTRWSLLRIVHGTHPDFQSLDAGVFGMRLPFASMLALSFARVKMRMNWPRMWCFA